MTNLSKSLRRKVADAGAGTVEILQTYTSKDGTQKHLFRLHDGRQVAYADTQYRMAQKGLESGLDHVKPDLRRAGLLLLRAMYHGKAGTGWRIRRCKRGYGGFIYWRTQSVDL